MPEPATHHSIKVVARMTGLSPDVIRAWERRYAAIAPARDDRQIRLYSDQDIERLLLLKEATALGHAIGRVATLPDADLAALVKPRSAPPPHGQSRLAQRVIEAVERLDPLGADDVLGEAAALLAPGPLIDEVVLPLLHHVGEAWRHQELGIATEHLTTGILRSLLGSLLRTRTIDRRHPPVLLATLPGEPHELGLLTVALRIASQGVPVCYLGPELPAAEIAGAAQTIDAFAVGLSMVLAPDPARLEALEALARDLAPGIGLWLGGPAVAALPQESLPSRALHVRDARELELRLRARTPR